MKYLLYEILTFKVYFFQLRDNDIVESEYVGWAMLPITPPIFHATIDITGWENMSESIVMKKVSVQLVNKNKYRISNRSPIICVFQVDDNETLSEVCEILNLVIQLK